MSITIGIATRNRSRLLEKAINSAIAQSYPDKRIVVFDDASCDETPSLQVKYPAVAWIWAEHPQGDMVARNTMMREAGTDYYLSLDDDAWFIEGDEIAQAVRQIENHPDAAAIAYDILSPDRPEQQPRTEPYRTHMYVGCGHMLRLSAAKAAGYYLLAPGSYGSEEKDLCIRLLDLGHQILYLPGVHIWHDKTTMARDLTAQHRSGVCNDLVFTLRRCPSPLVWPLLPSKVLSHLHFALKRRLIWPSIQGVWLFLRSAPQVMPTRQPVCSRTFRSFQQMSRRPGL